MSTIDPDVALLIEFQARIDALFAPLRFNCVSSQCATAVFEQREAYRSRGLPMTGGGSSASRMAKSRQIARLRKAGLLTVHGRTSLSARLTAAAENSISALTGRFRVSEVFELLEVVAEFTSLGYSNSGCVEEPLLLGVRSYDGLTSDELNDLELRTTPLLVRDWLLSHSDTKGRVGYHITRTGRAAIAAGLPPEGDLPAFDEAAGDLYDVTHADALQSRNSMQQENRSRIVIPLGAGSWPEVPARG